MVNRRKFSPFLPFIILNGSMILLLFLDPHPIFAYTVEELAVVKKTIEWDTFFFPLLILGGIITITLTYVSWRKYSGEQKSKKNRDNMVD